MQNLPEIPNLPELFYIAICSITCKIYQKYRTYRKLPELFYIDINQAIAETKDKLDTVTAKQERTKKRSVITN